ncbi:GerAB/ArcD/ProY family transporter [Paenibacillus silvisoli]|uniref:GerAB/ArcD/ProY family transporter n=1 Tax=Paenibacillus silvisoli TaxID=3110539 RepID=UPI002803AC64|nr:endospore germination permease [Paenibacillus silvisoli]
MNVSKSQLFWMIFISEIVLLSYFALGPSLKQAKQDIWISYLLAGGGALIGTYLMMKVSFAYGSSTMVTYVQSIMGKWLGKLIALGYIVFWLLLTMMMLHGTVDFISTNLLYQTPTIVIVVLEIALMIYFNVQGGITTIGRCSQVIGPLLFAAAFLPLLLNSSHMDFEQLLPVYQDGSLPVAKGSVLVYCFIGDTSVLLMVISFMKQSDRSVPSVIRSVSFGALWGLLMSIAVIVLFGATSAADMYHPQFMFMKSISILDFIQNFDLVITFFLQFGIMIKLASLLFISSYGLAEWLKIRNWKVIAWIMAALHLAGMILTSKLNFELLFLPWIFLTFNLALPALLYLVHRIRHAL